MVRSGAAGHPAESMPRDESRLRYAGSLSPQKIEQLLQESAIYIVTSRYEPFGLAAVEAALAGCAIVASDLASQREIWNDAAVYFPSDDADALEARLAELSADPERLRTLAGRCRARAIERFSAAAMLGAYVSLYGELSAAGYPAPVEREDRGACVA